MGATPRPDELRFVDQRTRALVRSQRPRLAKFWGYAPPPLNTVAPVASGNGTVGQTLSCTQGTWSNSPTAYAFQWLRDGVAVAGATTSTRLLLPADSGTNMSCRVTATNASGSASATSNAIAVA